jgi:RNA polymerase sigma factor (TIGR02999 family)
MADITRILAAANGGDPHAAAELLPLVYDELRKLAAARMAEEALGQTLQPTALVHEAYLRLVGPDRGPHFDHCGHFFAAAAEAMRRVLLDRARDKGRLKRGGGWRRVSLDQIDHPLDRPPDDLLAFDEALVKLAREDPVSAELVKLRVYAGLSLGEAARALGLARRTADRCWAFARSWLYDDLRGGDDSAGG